MKKEGNTGEKRERGKIVLSDATKPNHECRVSSLSAMLFCIWDRENSANSHTHTHTRACWLKQNDGLH